MKKTIKIAALALVVSVTAVSCKKKVDDAPSPSPIETLSPPPVETISAVAPEVVQKVTDALKDFPGVKSEVVNGVLTLTGNVSPDQARKIKMSIDALKIGKYENKLTVK